jgi:hypothetical protein
MALQEVRGAATPPPAKVPDVPAFFPFIHLLLSVHPLLQPDVDAAPKAPFRNAVPDRSKDPSQNLQILQPIQSGNRFQDTAAPAPVSSGQIADALVRSMLGASPPVTPPPANATVDSLSTRPSGAVGNSPGESGRQKRAKTPGELVRGIITEILIPPLGRSHPLPATAADLVTTQNNKCAGAVKRVTAAEPAIGNAMGGTVSPPSPDGARTNPAQTNRMDAVSGGAVLGDPDGAGQDDGAAADLSAGSQSSSALGPVAFAARLSAPEDSSPSLASDRSAPTTTAAVRSSAASKRDSMGRNLNSEDASAGNGTSQGVSKPAPGDPTAAASSTGRSDTVGITVAPADGSAHFSLPYRSEGQGNQPLQVMSSPSMLSQGTSSAGTARVHEMTLRIAAPDSSTVDVQVNQRQGEVFVAVRTVDQGLQASLRQDLPQLVTSLDRAGFRAETFVPHTTPEGVIGATAELSGNSPHDSANDSPRDSPQDSGDGAWRREYGSPNHNQQQQQRPREQLQLRWLDQMED